MTRKEELQRKASQCIKDLSDFRSDLQSVVLAHLQQVEREVWKLAKSKALSMVDYAGDDYKLKVYADWCEAQQKELA